MYSSISFNENQHRMVYPNNLKYSKDHTWVRVDGDRATIGITDFAQSWIGNLLNIDLFEENSEIERLGMFGTLETSKVSLELYSSVSGTIVKKNEKLMDQIALITHQPYGEGWMIVLRMRDIHDLADLMDVEAYEEYVKHWEDLERSFK